MWQYMYKAFIARYDMCSLKVMYKALKESSEVIQTTECILILFWLHRMTLLTQFAFDALVTATEHLLIQYKTSSILEDM